MNYNLYDTGNLPSWAINPDPGYSYGGAQRGYYNCCCQSSCCYSGTGTGVGGAADTAASVLPAAAVTPAVTIPLYDKCGCPLKTIFMPAGFTPVLPATYPANGVAGATTGSCGTRSGWGGYYCGC
ncbi:MAG: hypothetical protein LBN97_07300 [Oscillospiraceae bacterium]|jgi:hypothetical protein|nr:hypothetical protein [Oscillospiraceae bacterium]